MQLTMETRLLKKCLRRRWRSRRIRSLGIRCHSRHPMNSPGVSYRSCSRNAKRLTRRLLHRENLHESVTNHQMVAMTVATGPGRDRGGVGSRRGPRLRAHALFLHRAAV
jgi:hypothetical protein